MEKIARATPPVPWRRSWRTIRGRRSLGSGCCS